MDKKIIAQIKNACALKEKITLKSKFTELSIDSLSFIELIVRIEDEFNITFSDDELDINLYPSVKEFINLVKGKVGNGNEKK